MSHKPSKLGTSIVLLFTIFLTAAGVITCYCVATLTEGLYFVLPTISETGDDAPSSCIFSFFLSSAAFLFAWVVFVRYLDVRRARIEGSANIVCLGFGFVFALGLLVVSAFQSSKVPVVHYIGATLLFLSSCTYLWIQAFLSVKVAQVRGNVSPWVIRSRFGCAVLETLSFLGCICFAVVWYVLEADTGQLYWWSYLAFCEYAMALSLALYFVTFFPEFSNIAVRVEVHGTKEAGSVNEALFA